MFAILTVAQIEWGDSIAFDYENQVVYHFKTYYGVIIDTVGRYSLEEFYSGRVDSLVYSIYYSRLKSAVNSQSNSGIISQITVPISMPRGLGFLGGNQAQIDIGGNQRIEFGGSRNTQIGPQFGGGATFPQLKMKQVLDVKVKGTIGTKLHVEIDHNSEEIDQTRRRVRLYYQGEEDEIFQLVELGDASRLSFPNTRYSSLPIGSSSGSLFGVRADMRFAGLKSTFVMATEKGQSESQSLSLSGQTSIDTIYARDYEKKRFFYIGEPDSVIILRVFLDDNNPTNDQSMGARIAKACYEADPTSLCQTGMFHELKRDSGYVYVGRNIIQMLVPIDDQYKIGVYYVTVNGRSVGDIDPARDTMLLKIIKLESQTFVDDNSSPEERAIWDLSLKNVYYIGFDSTTVALQMSIYRDDPNIDPDGENGRTFLQILRLDANGDNLVDPTFQGPDGKYYPILYRGYLIFPDFKPFASDSLSVRDTVMYNKYNLLGNEGRLYYMVAVRQKSLDVIQLPPDVLKGSVKVTVDGRNLVEGKDYIVDYALGELRFKTYIDPNATINISYEVGNLFSLSRKSILGIRNTYDINERLSIGNTFLMRSVGSRSFNPAIGEEGSRTRIVEFDIRGDIEVPVVDKLLFRLPGYQSTRASRLTISGEYAQSFPVISTLGFAYIDDMENIDIPEPLPISIFKWHFGSPPVDETLQPMDTSYFASYVSWSSGITRRDSIYPPSTQTTNIEGSRTESYLILKVRPAVAGSDQNWAAITTLLDGGGRDFSMVNFIEVVVRGNQGKIGIDVGFDIPEDAPRRDKYGNIKGYNGRLDSEDTNGNCIIEAALGEDSGLDGVAGDDNLNIPGDDGNDDYDLNLNPIGTEGNGRLDSEGLVNCKVLNTNSNFYTFIIDLENDPPVYEYNGWKFYRIPFREPDIVVGNPTPYNIRYARIWYKGFRTDENLLIHKVVFKGTKWLVENPDTSGSIGVSTVSYKTNPEYFPPAAVFDRLRYTDNGKEDEHSLAIAYTSLLPSVEYSTYRALSRSNDLSYYRKIAFYVKPGPTTLPPYPVIRFKFGKDSLNYYFYDYPISSSEWQEVFIDMDSIAAFKKEILDMYGDSIRSDTIYRRGNYGFRGSPNLLDIKYYAITLINPSSNPISGVVWVDDIRVVEPKPFNGYATYLDLAFNAGEISDLRLSFERKVAGFKGLTQDRPSNDNIENLSFNTRLDMGKLLPRRWRFNIPITYGMNRSISYPKYKTGTDIVVEEDKYMYGSFSESRNYSVSFSKGGSTSRLMRYLIDPMRISYSYSESKNRNYIQTDTSRGQQFSVGYNLRPNQNRPPKLLGKSIYYLPRNISLNWRLDESYTVVENFLNNSRVETPVRKTERSAGITYAIINNLNNSYSRRESYDHIRNKKASMSESFNNRLDFRIFMIRNSITYNASYSENAASTTDTSRIYNINQRTDVSYNLMAVGLMQRLPWLFRNLSDPNITASYSRNFSIPYQTTGFPYRFRLGLSFPQTDSVYTWGENFTIRASERFNNSFMNLSLDGNMNMATTYSNVVQKTVSYNYPSLSISLTPGRYLPGFLRRLVNAPSIRSGYSKSVSRNTTIQPDGFTDMAMTISENFSPLLSMTMTLRDGTSISINSSRTRSVSTTSGYTSLTTISTMSNFSVSLTRTFTPTDNFFLVSNLKSNLTISLRLDITSSRQESITEYGHNVDSDNYNRNFTIEAAYDFNRNVRANLNITSSKSISRLTGMGTSSFSIMAYVNFNF